MEDASAIFPHPLSQVLVTALHCIPANYPHELRRTKTAQCGGSEAQPRLGARDGETRHFVSAPAPAPPRPGPPTPLTASSASSASAENMATQRGEAGLKWRWRRGKREGDQKWRCKDGRVKVVVWRGGQQEEPAPLEWCHRWRLGLKHRQDFKAATVISVKWFIPTCFGLCGCKANHSDFANETLCPTHLQPGCATACTFIRR